MVHEVAKSHPHLLLLDAAPVVTDVVVVNTGVESLLGLGNVAVDDWGNTVRLAACLVFLNLCVDGVLGSLRCCAVVSVRRLRSSQSMLK